MHIPQRPTDRSILGWSEQGASGLALAADRLRLVLATDAWPLPVADLPAGSALVGGAVRDGLLGRLAARPDLDLVVPVEAIALCQTLSRRHGGSAVVLDAKRSIARLVLKGWSIDLARQVGGSLEADLARRDFRLNALALPLRPGAPLLDPTAGLKDLANGQVVAVAEANLREDPLRLLRGIRLAAELGFALGEETLDWIQAHHHLITQVAPERVLAELEKLAGCPDGGQGLALACESRLLESWRPRWQLASGATNPGPDSPCRAAAARCLEQLTTEQARLRGLLPPESSAPLGLARLAVIFDGAGLASLRGSRQLQQRCERLHHWWRLLGQDDKGPESLLDRLPEPERLRLHQQIAGDLPALLLFFPPPLALAWLERWRDPADPLFHPHPPLDGRELQELLGLAPSRRLGQLLGHLCLERAFGRISNSEEALKAASIWLNGTAS